MRSTSTPTKTPSTGSGLTAEVRGSGPPGAVRTGDARGYLSDRMFVRGDRRAGLRVVARAALMPVAALAVHELRFVLAFGGHAGVELQRQGHSYLHSLAPWIVLLLAASVGGFLWVLGRALWGHRSLPRYTLSLAGLWLACSAALVAIFVAQELLEGLFATGHPRGLAGIFGYSGWWSIPASVCVGLVVAIVFHGARWLLDEVARRRSRPGLLRSRPAVAVPVPRNALLPRLLPLAEGRSGRGPPR
jgi:hypothetical protein